MKLGGIKLKGGRWFVMTFWTVAVVLTLLLASFTVQAVGPKPVHSVEVESWLQGYCPTCGALPDFAYLADDGARYLVCSQCNTEWRFPRLKCPFCGNEDQKTLGYFFADAENWHAYRIYVCEKCHKYLKAIDSRSAGSKTITLWERIKTITLERYVESMGYTPGWKVVVYD